MASHALIILGVLFATLQCAAGAFHDSSYFEILSDPKEHDFAYWTQQCKGLFTMQLLSHDEKQLCI